MKKRPIGRTRFGDIVAEFLPPARASRKVVIYCGGMPSGHDRGALLRFLSSKGYWAFAPRYRGSWESSGRFLKISPEKDVLDVLNALSRGFRNLWDGTAYRVRPSAAYVIGASFGGPAAILASRDPRVKKAVALSPVIDWRVESETEPIDWMAKFVRQAFGEAYRGSARDWKKLKRGAFYNPAAHVREIDGRKLLLIHAKDDRVVAFRPTEQFAKATGAALVPLGRGGHLSSSLMTKPAVWKKIRRFLGR